MLRCVVSFVLILTMASVYFFAYTDMYYNEKILRLAITKFALRDFAGKVLFANVSFIALFFVKVSLSHLL